MPDDLLFGGYDPFSNPDPFLCLLVGGMKRAEQRHHDKLNTIYVDAPQIEQVNGPHVEPDGTGGWIVKDGSYPVAQRRSQAGGEG